MDIQLKNKVILVNGVTGAIGEAVARKCMSLGAEVLGIYGKDTLKAETLLSKNKIKSLSIDLSRKKITPAILKKFLGKKKVYGIVNAGGLTRDKPLVRIDEKDWDDVVRVNLSSIFYLMRSILPYVMEKGRIINLSSSAGLIGGEGQASYASAKAGLWAFTKTLAREVAEDNIMVNLILPGFVPSKMTEKASSSIWEYAKEESLTGEVMTPDVVSDFIVYLLSKYSQGITGQAFNIDNRIRRWW